MSLRHHNAANNLHILFQIICCQEIFDSANNAKAAGPRLNSKIYFQGNTYIFQWYETLLAEAEILQTLTYQKRFCQSKSIPHGTSFQGKRQTKFLWWGDFWSPLPCSLSLSSVFPSIIGWSRLTLVMLTYLSFPSSSSTLKKIPPWSPMLTEVSSLTSQFHLSSPYIHLYQRDLRTRVSSTLPI